ncbi:hypothetical protein Bca4012_037723 [Brassica carinata]
MEVLPGPTIKRMKELGDMNVATVTSLHSVEEEMRIILPQALRKIEGAMMIGVSRVTHLPHRGDRRVFSQMEPPHSNPGLGTAQLGNRFVEPPQKWCEHEEKAHHNDTQLLA